jgi:hypothetical protein
MGASRPQRATPPADAVVRAARHVGNKFLADPAVRAKLNDQYLAPIPGTPAGIQKRGEAEAGVWGGLIRDSKIQAD